MKKAHWPDTATHLALGGALLLAASTALAQNATRGKQLYEARINPNYFSCADTTCHGPDPATDLRNVRRGTTATAILTAINTQPQMGPLRGLVSNTDATDLAAYIVNPAAANAAALTASGNALSFGPTQVATTNVSPVPASITLTNSGNGNLLISAINKSGTNAADFTATGTCVGAATVTVAPGASCTLSASFVPSAGGTRTATLTVASNAANNPAIALSGAGSTVPVPAVTLSRTSVTFATQTVGRTSAAQSITLTNSGTAALTVTQVAASPAAEFAATSNCVGTVAASGSCTINVTFGPTAAGTRVGSLAVTSNAASSPNTVTLSGVSVLTDSAIATIASTSMTFPTTSVGVNPTPQGTTLTNSGNAAMQITSVSLGGPDPADFRMGTGNTCATGALAVGASCRVEVEFRPQSAGSKSAMVTVAHNAAGGPTSIAVSGTAAATATSGVGATSSALAPSNIGGGGAISLSQFVALGLTLLLGSWFRRRGARG